MSDRRMSAYYYSFTATGVEVIDKVLGAVACAGKAYHHTEDWCDDTRPYDDHTGAAPVDWIQNAGIEAAARIQKLEAALSWLQPPFIDEKTPEAELRQRIAFCIADANRALAKP